MDIALDGIVPPRSLGGTPDRRPDTADDPAIVTDPDIGEPDRVPVDAARGLAERTAMSRVPDPASGSLTALDSTAHSTALGPSLPRRAGSLVRRWVMRVVSFLKRLPGKLGLTANDPDAP